MVAARLRVLAAALLFSTGGAAIKATALSNWQVACFRSLVAALTLLLLVPATRRASSPRIVPVSIAYALTMILFVSAAKLTTAANTIFLESTGPLYILILAPWLLGERLVPADLPFIGVLALGMSLFFVGTQETFATAPDPLRGNVLAAASGLTWGCTVLGLRWLAKTTGGPFPPPMLAAVVAGNLIAFGVCLPLALPLGEVHAIDVAMVLFLGVVQVGLAYVFLTGAMPHVRALDASLLLLAEPVLNPIWAWAVHGERPGGWSLAGGALILTATTVRAWRHGSG